jgi:hypothetical protein
MKLFLDDVRECPDDYIHVKTVFELIGYLKYYQEIITDISLDHDLGIGQLTGYDFCKWFEREFWKQKLPINFTIHSQNPVGAGNMKRVLKIMGYV